MTLASILRAQLATGRPLRVTRALLEALDASETDGGDLAAYARASAAERELADLDLVLPVACGSRVDAVREIEQERDDARRERDEALAHEERLAEQAGGRLLDAVNRAERLERERDEERARANEWCAQKHDAERQRDEALRASDDYAQRYAVAMLNGSRAFTERDEARRELAEARRELAEAQQSLRERVAEREALCERVSVLEETMAKVRWSVVHEAHIDAIDEALRGRPSMHEYTREIHEAQVQGALWAIAALLGKSATPMQEDRRHENAERICAEARKAGEHG